MKIAVISMIREAWGGSEELWYQMAKIALKNGHDVIHLAYDVAEMEHPKIAELKVLGMTQFKRPSLELQINETFIKKTIGRIKFFFRKRLHKGMNSFFASSPDILLYNGTCYSIKDEVRLLNFLRSNTRTHFYHLGHFNPEDDPELTAKEKERIKFAYNRAVYTFFVSNRSQQNAEKHLGTHLSNSKIIRNPVNMNNIDILPFPAMNTPQLAIVGNLIKSHKGQDIVLSILSKKEWLDKDWHLNIYGKGIDENDLKEAATSLLPERVTFHGKVNDIRQLWSKNHILLMPSRMEGMPLALVETMLCSRPSVVTDVGGNAEWIDDGENGFVSLRADESSFEDAMKRAFSLIHSWEKLGSQAREKAIKQYDKNSGDTLLQLLLKKF